MIQRYSVNKSKLCGTKAAIFCLKWQFSAAQENNRQFKALL
jgi:hypothetical protein